ncbi:hypothetical protein Acr_13g0005160 [Actinidia rufa]|uniref:Uncharacterized protein n=1 Tax=Actinidia rufa TaxID=165716 RepID=A0A7J0FK93_9ERIC|nr:hypothetical protein Acr_13g0005160 [Actinidia rufa]
MRNRSILVQNEKENQPREAEVIERKIDVHGGKKKTVRFRFNEEDGSDKERNGYSKNGAVRIRVVVTRREVDSDFEETSDERTNRGWRPALESIPEDH